MSIISFTASVENGTIKIPEQYQQEMSNVNQVRVTVIKKKKISETGILSRLIKEPIQIKNFIPLTRDEIHERK